MSRKKNEHIDDSLIENDIQNNISKNNSYDNPNELNLKKKEFYLVRIVIIYLMLRIIWT